MSNDQDALRAKVRAIPASPPPAPWKALPTILVGGQTDVGVRAVGEGELVLTISHSGRGVFNDRGARLARDYEEPNDRWLDAIGLEAEGIGPLGGERVRIAGLSGGGLPTSTHDGWHVTNIPVDWPSDLVILEPPGCGALWQGHEPGCVAVFGPDLVELRAFGFSPTGRALIIATAADLRLYVR